MLHGLAITHIHFHHVVIEFAALNNAVFNHHRLLADGLASQLENAGFTNLRYAIGSRLGDIDEQLEAEMRRNRFAGLQVGKTAYPVKQARDLLWMLGRLYPDKSFEA